ASGRCSVAMPTAPWTSVLIFIAASSFAFGTIEGGPAGLNYTLHAAFTAQFAWLAFPAIDQEMVLEIAGIAGGLGVVAQRRAAGGDGILQDFPDCLDQGWDAFHLDGARHPLGRDARAKKCLADIDIAQSCNQPLIQQGGFDRCFLAGKSIGQIRRL